MNLRRDGETLFAILTSECGIASVEEDAQALGAELADPAVRDLEFAAADVEDMDTAYFQLLLAARREIAARGGKMRITPMPHCLTELTACYGLHLD